MREPKIDRRPGITAEIENESELRFSSCNFMGPEGLIYSREGKPVATVSMARTAAGAMVVESFHGRHTRRTHSTSKILALVIECAEASETQRKADALREHASALMLALKIATAFVSMHTLNGTDPGRDERFPEEYRETNGNPNAQAITDLCRDALDLLD